MKIFLIAIAVCAIKVFGQLDYKAMATRLHQRIGTTLVGIHEVQTNVKKQLKQLTLLDYGFAKNFRIIEIQDTFNRLVFKPGIGHCGDIYRNTSRKLHQEYQNIIKPKLNSRSSELATHEKILTNIQKNLSTTAKVNAELSLCALGPETCRLMGAYPAKVSKAENLVKYEKRHLPKLTNEMIQVNITPRIFDDINIKVYKPVKECIDNLK